MTKEFKAGIRDALLVGVQDAGWILPPKNGDCSQGYDFGIKLYCELFHGDEENEQ